MKEKTITRFRMSLREVGLNLLLVGVLTAVAAQHAEAVPPQDGGNGCIVKDGRIVVAIGSGCDSIQEAMDNAPGTAAAPTVIDVRPGTYVIDPLNPIVMKSYVHLRGAGREVTFLVSNDIVMEADVVDNWAVSGFTFDGPTGSGYGILGSEIRNVTVSDNTFTGLNHGLFLYTVNNLTISGNRFAISGQTGGATSYGVSIDGGEPITIIGNQFETPKVTIDNTIGIYVSYSKDTTIETNTITGHDIGMELFGAGSQSGAYTVTGNTVQGSATYGIFAGLRVAAMIEGNKIVDGQTGIWLDSTLATVTGNTITGNGKDGIESRARDGAGSPEIQANTITGNAEYGIRVQFNSDPSIIHNKITGNGGGTFADVFVYDSTLTTPHISWNVYDTLAGGTNGFGQFNLKSDGTPAPAP